MPQFPLLPKLFFWLSRTRVITNSHLLSRGGWGRGRANPDEEMLCCPGTTASAPLAPTHRRGNTFSHGWQPWRACYNDELCHLRNLPLSTIYRCFCFTCNLVLKCTRILWLLCADTFIGDLSFLFLGAIYTDNIYFIINLRFVWIEPYSLKYLRILSFDQINFLLGK